MKRPLEGEAVSRWKKVNGRIYHVGAYRRGISTFLVVERLLSNERVRVLVFKPWARRPPTEAAAEGWQWLDDNGWP